MFKGMAGSVFGVWVAHGEGQFVFENEFIKRTVKNANLVSLQYVDDASKVTTEYPLNPNGSHDGIAAICSADGRHLAMMPHPERSTLSWQLPYLPPSYSYIKDQLVSPWAKMFENAYRWAEKH